MKSIDKKSGYEIFYQEKSKIKITSSNKETNKADFIKPGSVLLSRALRHNIIAVEDFRFPVRDGMERVIPRHDRQAK